MNIRFEEEKDYRTVETLTREAFWNVYKPGCVEHFVLHQFRTNPDFIKELDFVLEDEVDGKTCIIAHVMFAKGELLRADGAKIPVCTFGPVSVLPSLQRKGYGKAILLYALEKAASLGYGAVCITGNIAFYGTVGFAPASAQNVRYEAAAPDDDAPYFLLKELIPGFMARSLAGQTASFKECSGYFVSDEEAAAFDKQFPPKQKLKLPGQLFE